MNYTKNQMEQVFIELEKLSNKYKKLIDEEENYADEILIHIPQYNRFKKKVLDK